MSEQNGVRRSLHLLLAELIDGPEEGRFTWVLNPGKGNGLLDSLRRLSGAEASAIRIPGRASIAAHANHLRFSLELLNRKSRGELYSRTRIGQKAGNCKRSRNRNGGVLSRVCKMKLTHGCIM